MVQVKTAAAQAKGRQSRWGEAPQGPLQEKGNKMNINFGTVKPPENNIPKYQEAGKRLGRRLLAVVLAVSTWKGAELLGCILCARSNRRAKERRL